MISEAADRIPCTGNAALPKYHPHPPLPPHGESPKPSLFLADLGHTCSSLVTEEIPSVKQGRGVDETQKGWDAAVVGVENQPMVFRFPPIQSLCDFEQAP